MLHSARALSQYEVHATDGKLGRAIDAYFDDVEHDIEYLVVETGRWLPGKKLFISKRTLGIPNKDTRQFPVELSRAGAELRQAVIDDLPVSWKIEELLRARYGELDRRGSTPVSAVHGTVDREALARVDEEQAQTSLRSLKEVLGYQIEAIDGPLGIAQDFLIDDEDWRMRYAVVDTKSWKPGREVLLPLEWIETVSWGEHRIHVNVKREKLKASQRIDRSSHVSERT